MTDSTTHPARVKSMLDRTASLIHQLFVSTYEESRKEAESLLAAIVEHGGQADSWETVETLVRKSLGSRLSWRSSTEHAQELARQTSTAASYNEYLDKTRPSWKRRW